MMNKFIFIDNRSKNIKNLNYESKNAISCSLVTEFFRCGKIAKSTNIIGCGKERFEQIKENLIFWLWSGEYIRDGRCRLT